MKLSLNGLQKFELSAENAEISRPEAGWVKAEVLYCGVCRTDAKLWNTGHRDLILPRVPGHEMVVRYNGDIYVAWPGSSCGTCRYCREGNENLCDDIRIIGFHLDGGFADEVYVPEHSLIPLPARLDPVTASFAEPVGCIVNMFKKLMPVKGDRMLIYGGGTLGLLVSAVAKEYGVVPLVIEKSDTKIQKAGDFIEKASVRIVKDTNESHFDHVINVCADPLAFLSGITRLRKGGSIGHFSGFEKNLQVETNLLNLIHYKELKIFGAYGLTKNDMVEAVSLLQKISPLANLLVEDLIGLNQVPHIIEQVLSGKAFKYVVDCSAASGQSAKISKERIMEKDTKNTSNNKVKELLNITDLSGVDETLLANARQKIDYKTKPLGALGTLESLAIKMSQIRNSLNPRINRKALFVFAADHGIAEEGVSAFPQEVTQQMVLNFLNKGAAINVLTSYQGIDLSIVDMGVKGEPIQHAELLNRRIAEGTKNFALQRAMTKDEAVNALKAGMEIFSSENTKQPIDILGLGEMGIANTTSASAIISSVTGISVAECVGRGTGIDDQGLEHKIKVINKALQFHKPDPKDALDVLSSVGGFEIAGMAGAMLAAASQRCAVVLDGLISTSAGLIAYLIDPNVANFMIAGHKSVEKGHIHALKFMNLEPVLDLNMRLGEGTGAALTIDLVDASCHIMCEMASFDDAGVTNNE